MSYFSRMKERLSGRWSPEQFWAWFRSEEGQRALGNLRSKDDKAAQAAMQAVATGLQRIHPDLVCGIVPPRNGEPGQFEVSGDGVRAMIPVVQRVVAAAPPMPDWRVVAFKQPNGRFSVRLANSDQEINPDTVLVVPQKLLDGGYDLDVYLPLPAAADPETIARLGFIVLDNVLGEYVVMTKLQRIDFHTVIVAPPTARPVGEFAAQLAEPG